MAPVVVSCLNFTWNNFVILVCIKKKTSKLVIFLYSNFNIEDGRKWATFWHIILYYFKKGKNITKTLKKICAVYEEGAVTDWTCQKWFVKFHAGDFSQDNTPRSCRQIRFILIKSVLCQVGDSQPTQNTHINQIIGENENCVFYFTENNMNFLANLILSIW